jgi:hypothetical protein
MTTNRWRISLAVLATLGVASATADTPAQAQSAPAAKQVVVIYGPHNTVQAWTMASVNVMSNTRVTAVEIAVTRSANSTQVVCSIQTQTLAEATALRDQINRDKTTEVECQDSGATSPSIFLTAPLGNGQTFYIKGNP